MGKSGRHVGYILRPKECRFFETNLAQDRNGLKAAFGQLEKQDLMRRCDARFQYRIIATFPNSLSDSDTKNIMRVLLEKTGIDHTSWVYAVHQGKSDERTEQNLHVHVAWNPRRLEDGKIEMAFQQKSWLRDFKAFLEVELSPLTNIIPVQPGQGGAHLGWKNHAINRALESGKDLSDLAVTNSERKVVIKLQSRRRVKKKVLEQTAKVIDLAAIQSALVERKKVREQNQHEWECRHSQASHDTDIRPQHTGSHDTSHENGQKTLSSRHTHRAPINHAADVSAVAVQTLCSSNNADVMATIKEILARILMLATRSLPQALSRLAERFESVGYPTSPPPTHAAGQLHTMKLGHRQGGRSLNPGPVRVPRP